MSWTATIQEVKGRKTALRKSERIVAKNSETNFYKKLKKFPKIQRCLSFSMCVFSLEADFLSHIWGDRKDLWEDSDEKLLLRSLKGGNTLMMKMIMVLQWLHCLGIVMLLEMMMIEDPDIELLLSPLKGGITFILSLFHSSPTWQTFPDWHTNM